MYDIIELLLSLSNRDATQLEWLRKSGFHHIGTIASSIGVAGLFLPQPCGAVAQVLESPIPFLEFIVEEFDQLPRTVLKYIFHQILTFKLTISIEKSYNTKPAATDQATHSPEYFAPIYLIHLSGGTYYNFLQLLTLSVAIDH